ncbi:MAG: SUMF1/EgtB/PvdO family nonheme iron enzyme [Leptolyngbyaceae cyanobacterium MO_188.B28]|nr:SUMF1/EgtB/PvdO family nonheme iron enzyme [Leptolyngbyaceae cyanobacterium MO_188.B28]
MLSPIKVFVSYSHKDESLRDELGIHLSSLVNRKVIEIWHDRQIMAGQEWATVIDENLDEAHIILLLVSSDFLASKYCAGIEMKRALERHEAGDACVIPIILRPVYWQGEAFGKLQAFPKDAKPVTKWADADEAFVDVVEGIAVAAKRITAELNAKATELERVNARRSYRAKVEQFYSDGRISSAERTILEIESQQLNLSSDEVFAIEQAVRETYRQHEENLKKYKQALVEEFHHQAELSSATRQEFKQLQQVLSLSDVEVEKAEQAVIFERVAEAQRQQEEAQRQAEAERVRQQLAEENRKRLEEEKLQRQAVEYQEKLQRYSQEFSRSVEANYPLDEFEGKKLQDFQQSLGLSDTDIAHIEQPILAPLEAEYQQHLKTEELRKHREAEELRKHREAKNQLSGEELWQQLQRFEFEFATVTHVKRTGLLGDEVAWDVSRSHCSAEFFIEDLGNRVILEMVSIPKGDFLMGSPGSEHGHEDHESPQHLVKLAPFFIGKFPITQTQWQAVAALPKVKLNLNPAPTRFKGRNRPVERVSWFEAEEFCHRLSQKTGRSYRLPSEAQWEYACRAGTTTSFHFGEALLPKLANYYGSQHNSQTTNVGRFKVANLFGLYDTHGNIGEWCADHWHGSYKGAPVDGGTWLSDNESARRLVRGGSWLDASWHCRSASRLGDEPANHGINIGFRVVC